MIQIAFDQTGTQANYSCRDIPDLLSCCTSCESMSQCIARVQVPKAMARLSTMFAVQLPQLQQ